MSRNFDADLSFDSAANKWSLDRLITYDKGQAGADELQPGQKLNDTALNDLRNAVQDLEIVNVRRKPKGLAADLKADKSLMENKESLQSLVSQGFIPQESGEGTEIFATGGETLIGTQVGVKYLLRFGEAVANLSSTTDEVGEGSGLRRYLLISAVFDESKFPPPDLEPLPETIEDMLARQNPAQQPGGSSPAATQPAAVEPETIEVPETESPPKPRPTAETTDAQQPAPQTVDEVKEPTPDASSESSEPNAGQDPNDCSPQDESEEKPADAATDSAATAASTESAESTPPTESAAPAATEPPAAGQEPPKADAAPAAETQPKKSEEELKEELEFVREQIAKENQRKIDARKEKMDSARKRVQELNARFADWYYVVSDSVYKKLKISRDQLIVADTPAAAGTATPPTPTFDLQQ